MSRILASGFEPFGKFGTNPSWDALKLASEKNLLPPDTHITRVPVDYETTFDNFATSVEAIKPEAAVSFGLHGGMKDRGIDVIYIEVTAKNIDDSRIADNQGQKRHLPIIDGALDTMPATFPENALLDALKEAGFNAQLSEDAGAFLCNHLFYRGLHAYSGRFPYGFVHVPPVDTMGGVLSLHELARAMGIIVNNLGRYA